MITPLEAAKLLSVSGQTIRNFMKNGTLPFIKIGGRYRIDENDVNAMLQKTPQNDKSDPLR